MRDPGGQGGLERGRRDQIDPAPQGPLQQPPRRHEGAKPGRAVELDQDVHIAVRPQRIPRRRPEQPHRAHAQRRQRAAGGLDAGAGLGPIGCRVGSRILGRYGQVLLACKHRLLQVVFTLLPSLTLQIDHALCVINYLSTLTFLHINL